MGKPADLFNLEYQRLTAEARQVFAETGVHPICEARRAYGTETVGEYLAYLTRIARTPNGVFGVKVDLFQASILMRRGLFWGGPLVWKYIYVTRQNLLMQAISFYRAIKTDAWSSMSASPKSDCEYDAGAILFQMRRLANMMAQWEFVFASLGIAPMRLTYEEIEADPRSVLARLASYVGVDCPVETVPLRSSYRKQRTAEAQQWAVDTRRAASACSGSAEALALDCALG
jgi:trehalose 2-sulfotransferase